MRRLSQTESGMALGELKLGGRENGSQDRPWSEGGGHEWTVWSRPRSRVGSQSKLGKQKRRRLAAGFRPDGARSDPEPTTSHGIV